MLGLVILVTLLFYAPFLRPTSQQPQISLPYSTFLAQVRAHNVTTAHLSATVASGAFARPYRDPASGTRYLRYTTTLLPVPDPALVPLLTARGVQMTAENQAPSLWLTVGGLLISVLPILFLLGLFYLVTRAARGQQQGIFGFGQSRAKLYTEERPSTTFADVAGVEAAKSEMFVGVGASRERDLFEKAKVAAPAFVFIDEIDAIG